MQSVIHMLQKGKQVMRRRRRRGHVLPAILSVLCIAVAACAAAGFLWYKKAGQAVKEKSPEELLVQYTEYLKDKEYASMYGMLGTQSRADISLEEFTERNKNIYEGIGASDIRIEIRGVEEKAEDLKAVDCQTTLNSSAGEISFFNQIDFMYEAAEDGRSGEEESGYKMIWSDRVIFPTLGRTDKVRVSSQKAARGRILDRNGELLAGMGNASLVGLVPGKLSPDFAGQASGETDGQASGETDGQAAGETSGQTAGEAAGQTVDISGTDLEHLCSLLGISPEGVTKKLAAKWVTDDSLVPVKTLKKVDRLLRIQSSVPDEEDMQNLAVQEALLTIPGVMITDTPVRSYPLGEAAAHLVGYVQNVTAEDLEEHKGEGYLTDSQIGRSGAETLFEKELKGQNGRSITIVDAEGNEKLVLASMPKIDGQDVRLTIDSGLQKTIYDTFRDVKGCTVAMNPYTGEVLALVNTPSYDDNDFILGMSEEKWASLNEDERHPMYNRFRQSFAPGSSFKPITGVIGLASGAIDPEEDYGNVGLSWQKDASWGKYFVTTLHDYDDVKLENAYIYSDNIYFAKAALKIGYDDFMAGLDRLGFNQELPFEISVAKSQYSNTERIETEIQLADSGYGQGQVLVNPIHLASLYTMFPNQGNVIKPYLTYKKDPVPGIWLENACTPEIAQRIETALEKVISSEHGTGHAAMRSDITLAGKTGTAEIKASKDDTTGTELGWFAVYTADESTPKPLLMVSMVEDVKNAGGSGLVVRKAKTVLDTYISPGE